LAGVLGIGFSIGAITAWGKSVVEATEHLKNLSVQTGSSVEELSRLSNIAKISGGSFETFETMIDRLAAGIGGTEEKTSRIGEALKLLGVNARDPATALQDVAIKLNTYADGANKAALAKAIFNRGGVEFLSVLKAIGEQSGIAATRTREQAEEATRLAESYRQLRINSQTLADAFLNSVVPALSDVIAKIEGARKASDSFSQFITNLAQIQPFASTAQSLEDVEKRLEHLRRKQAEFAADTARFKFRLGPDPDEEIKRLTKLQEGLQAIRLREFGGPPTNEPANKPQAPRLAALGLSGADDASRKILDGIIKGLDAGIEREKDALNARAEYLRDYYQEGFLSVAQFFDKLQGARDEEVARVLRFYDDEIAAARDYQAKATKASDREEAQNKIRGFQEKQAKLLRDAFSQEDALIRERNHATQQYGEQLDELNAKLFELAGNTAAAGAIRFDQQNRIFLNSLKASGDVVNAANVASLKSQLNLQDKLNDELRKYSNAIGAIGVEQARVDLAAQTGALTEIEAINKKAEVAARYIAILSKEADAYQAIAAALPAGVARDAAALQAARLRLEIDQLAASANALRDKFRDVFQSSFAENLSAFIQGTKSAKTAALDFLKSVEGKLSDIASKNIAESLFGEGGFLGAGGAGLDVGGFFAKIFGGKGLAGDKTGALALSGAGATLTTAGVSLSASAAALTAAAGTLAASGALSAGAGFSSIVGGVGWTSGFDLGGFASGGTPPVGRYSLVGERGPELFMPKSAGTIIPHEVLMRRRGERQAVHITNNITVAGSTDTRSAAQIARETGLTVLRALSHI
jgi:hypothetical protein